MLSQILYSSKALSSMDSAELEQILDDARTGNELRGVTGALIYVDGVFVQILEGEQAVLDALLASIRDDSRHGAMKVFHEAEIAERAFNDWRMAYLSADVADMGRWAGLQGTGNIDDLLTHLYRDPERVPRILLSIVKAIAEQAGPR